MQGRWKSNTDKPLFRNLSQSVTALVIATGIALQALPVIAEPILAEPVLTEGDDTPKKEVSLGENAEGASNEASEAERGIFDAAQDDKRNNRDGQNIDEPQLDPMFGGRKKKDDRLTPEEIANDGGNTLQVERLEGFTGILTFLAPEDTELSLGVGPVIRPDYFGSDNYELDADPQIYLKINNFQFFDDDGADFALFGFSGFRIGPSVRVVGDRDEDENPALTGLGRVGTTFELGGFASTTLLNRYSFKFKVRQGIATGHRGLIVDAFGTALLFRYGRFSSSISAQASWIGNDYADAFFSVTPEQSQNSGLQVFDARSGFRNIGGSLNGYVNLGQRWSLNPYVSYDLIIGNIVDTPIISEFGSRNQVRAGFHLIRQFKIF